MESESLDSPFWSDVETQPRRRKNVKVETPVWDEFFEPPISGPVINGISRSKYALCWYGLLYPVLMAPFFLLCYLTSRFYEYLFEPQSASVLNTQLFEGFVLLLCLLSFVLAIQFVQQLLLLFCRSKRRLR